MPADHLLWKACPLALQAGAAPRPPPPPPIYEPPGITTHPCTNHHSTALAYLQAGAARGQAGQAADAAALTRPLNAQGPEAGQCRQGLGAQRRLVAGELEGQVLQGGGKAESGEKIG